MAEPEQPTSEPTDAEPSNRAQPNADQPTRDIVVERGNAVVPDSEDAPRKDDLLPEDPPDAMPAEGDPDKKSAVAPPVPAHGEMASREQIQEAARAAEEEDERA